MNAGPLVWSYLIFFVLFMFISVAYNRVSKGGKARKGPKADSVLLLLVNVVAIILPLIYAFSSLFDQENYSLPNPLGLIGVFGLVAALLIKVKAHSDLGRNFTTDPGPKGRLITNGIYSYVRHPLYLSLLVAGISTPLVLQNYIAGLVPLICGCIFITVRVPIEERMLLEEFGDQYRSYMIQTGRLMPRLGR